MSKIEWTEKTWNPVTGCTKISEGCKNCYAETLISRFGDVWKRKNGRGFKVETHPNRLDEPLKWKEPTKIFVCSMSDLFHKDVPDEFISKVWGTMMMSHRHQFMILTKRPERMRSFIIGAKKEGTNPEWERAYKIMYKNVWLGVSAENQRQADKRIPILLSLPAAKRFVSIEPMLGPIDLKDYLNTGLLHWVIVGAESGPKARPFDEQWAREIKDQCVEADVPFFYKQGRINGKLVKMPKLDGHIWDQQPK